MPHRLRCDSSWFDRVSKKPSLKADLVIYSYIVTVSGQYLSVVITLSNKMDFSYCDNTVGFHNLVTYRGSIIKSPIVINQYNILNQNTTTRASYSVYSLFSNVHSLCDHHSTSPSEQVNNSSTSRLGHLTCHPERVTLSGENIDEARDGEMTGDQGVNSDASKYAGFR